MNTVANDSSFRTLLSAENDEGFRALIEDQTERGLRMIGWVGMGVLLLYVISHMIAGRQLSIEWADKQTIVIWDKIFIVLTLAVLIRVSRSSIGRRAGRQIGCLTALLGASASMADDLMNGDVTFSSAWFALFLVAVASSLPLRPQQVLSLAAVLLAGFVTSVVLAPAEVSDGSLRTQSVFLMTVVILVTVTSIQLYRARHRLYLAGRRNRELAEEIARKADRLEQVEALKTRFFTGVTHDIRTPLSLILGPLSDVLSDGTFDLPDELQAPLTLARRNAQHLRVLIDDLLDLAHIDSGRLLLKTAPHPWTEVVSRCVMELQPLAERHRVRLSSTGEKNLVAEFDPDRMTQVITNLMSNAITHSEPGGSVEVNAVRGSTGEVLLEVSDHGAGIPEAALQTVFDRFHRGDDASPRSGYGLGLAIAREFVELHGGRIEVESEVGTGTLFRVILPPSSEPALPLPERESDSAILIDAMDFEETAHADAGSEHDGGMDRTANGAARKLPTVLVADDNPDMRAYLRMHLAGRYRLLEAEDGTSALALVQTERPDLVLSDVVMPGMTGIELCRAIRKNEDTSATPVVLLTASGDHMTQLDGLAAGADDFLTKPFDADALVLRLENLIELRRMLRTGAPLGTVPVGPSPVDVQSTEAAFVERVKTIVEDHLANSNFGVDWLADEVGLSTRQLQRRLRDATRLSAAGFIRMLRLGRAAGLIAAGAANVSEAAYAVGFRDTDHFAHLFKQAYGVPPSGYPQSISSGRPSA